MIRSAIALATTAALVVVALLTGLAAPLPAADSPTRVVEDWAKQPDGKSGIPDGWKGQSWGSPKYDFRIVTQGGRKVLHLKSGNDSSTISKELKVDVKRHPILTCSWQAAFLPKGADARKSATDY